MVWRPFFAKPSGGRACNSCASQAIPPKPLHDEDLHDIIEGAGQLRWANSGAAVIDKPIKQLLETLRAFRNATAHPRQRPLEAGSELAVLAAKQAAALWADASIPKRRLKSKEVQKSW